MSTEETPRRGRIGVEIFEQVEKLVSEQGLTRTQAFEKISEETGRRSGTVAANYYRIARKRGAALAPRGRRGTRRGGAGRKDTEAVLQRASDAIGELTSLVKQQEKELARLREQSEQFEKFKKWMEKNA
jgi:hypothetical protein